MILRDHEEDGHVVLNAALRSFPPLQPITLKWSFPLWLAADDLDPSRLAKPNKKSDTEALCRVLEILASNVSPMATSAIRKATGFNKEKADRLMVKLTQQGKVAVELAKHQGREISKFSIMESEDSEKE